MKECYVCKRRLPLEEFSLNRLRSDGRQSLCKLCKKTYNQNYYHKTKEVHNPGRRERSTRVRNENHSNLLSYFATHSCVDCGEKDVRVLEFDHLGDKSYNISSMMASSWEKISAEIEKCDVVCSNCHRIRTYERISSYRCLGGDSDQVRYLTLNQE